MEVLKKTLKELRRSNAELRLPASRTREESLRPKSSATIDVSKDVKVLKKTSKEPRQSNAERRL